MPDSAPVEPANQKHLYGVFGDAQWTHKDRLPDELLKDLIEHFSALPLGNDRVTADVLGPSHAPLAQSWTRGALVRGAQAFLAVKLAACDDAGACRAVGSSGRLRSC